MAKLKEKHKSSIRKGSSGADSDRISFLQKKWLVPFIKRNDIELKNKKIIDIGCGGGSSTFALAIESEECHVVGVDVELPSINSAIESHNNFYKDLNIEFFHMQNKNSIDFEDNQFDLVVFNAVFEHIYLSDRERLLVEGLRVLKTNGNIILIGTPNKWFPKDSHTSKLWFVPWMPLYIAKLYVLFRNGAIKSKDALAKSDMSILEKLDKIPEEEWIFRGIRGTGFNEIKKWANNSGIDYRIVNNDHEIEIENHIHNSKFLSQNNLIKILIKIFVRLQNILNISIHNFLPYLNIVIQKTDDN